MLVLYPVQERVGVLTILHCYGVQIFEFVISGMLWLYELVFLSLM